MLEEVAASNSEQIELKKRDKDKAIDEDRRITAYLREREARDQKRMQEEEAVKVEKDRVWSRQMKLVLKEPLALVIQKIQTKWETVKVNKSCWAKKLKMRMMGTRR